MAAKIKHWKVPKEWSGEPCFILGGGPSLTQSQVDQVRGKGRVIAINSRFQMALWADILYFCDDSWWTKSGPEVLKTFQGRVVTLDTGPKEALVLRDAGDSGLEVADNSAIRNGRNSGYQAINLAVHLGAYPIYLLGYDMVAGTPPYQPGTLGMAIAKVWLPLYDTLAPELTKARVKVFNCTPASGLKVFPYVPLDSATEIQCSRRFSTYPNDAVRKDPKDLEIRALDVHRKTSDPQTLVCSWGEGQRFQTQCNGRVVPQCFNASAVDGMAEVYEHGEDGKIVFCKWLDGIRTVKVYGDIEIRPIKKKEAAVCQSGT